jgi:cyclopropane fatty-acyl-phospholipid synthase-like methyltransferase
MKYPFTEKFRSIVPALFSVLLLYVTATALCQDYERDSWQKPDEVVKSLNLKPGEVIADIGAGNGYFTRLFAQAVDPGGQALGLEVVSSNVESMRRDAESLGLDSYKAVLVEPDDPGFEPGSMDVVFLCNAYHHLSNRVDYFKKVSGGLKQDGRVVIVDFYNRQMDVGPPPNHTLAKEVVLEEMKEAGYQLQSDKDFLEYQYYLEFVL